MVRCILRSKGRGPFRETLSYFAFFGHIEFSGFSPRVCRHTKSHRGKRGTTYPTPSDPCEGCHGDATERLTGTGGSGRRDGGRVHFEWFSRSIAGTSSSDSITTHGTMGDDTNVTFSLSKPDGRLDTMTQMAVTLTIKTGSGDADQASADGC